ncbi:hypothetical protein QBC40DRAFT_61436 [Triangularia verruculosa]|uniref:Secreted protein n=1 Tax=Triangularia verruculosa TaxID=2587418 RepID=A0AAN7AU52_9PEZI|nr:hypothetical protein QBC40DRAFT_61436 [Triangularia verruculosa]
MGITRMPCVPWFLSLVLSVCVCVCRPLFPPVEAILCWASTVQVLPLEKMMNISAVRSIFPGGLTQWQGSWGDILEGFCYLCLSLPRFGDLDMSPHGRYCRVYRIIGLGATMFPFLHFSER